MPGNPVKIGPFLGGLNNMSTAGEAKDNELIELINMEVSKDQSLTMRPPITAIQGTTKRHVGGSPMWDILDIYRVNSADWYVIVLEPMSSTTWDLKAYKSGDLSVAGIAIKTGLTLENRITGVAQFRNELFFLVGTSATIPCFKWELNGVVTDITTMPKGSILLSWKTRLWISGTLNSATGDRVWFSKVGAEGPEPSVWEVNDFFDVAPGEGGYITSLMPSFNNLIVFKSDGTWRFSYPASPKQGTIDKISGQVGAASKNSVVEFENFIYVYDQGHIYELVNSNLSQLNTFVNLEEDPLSVDGAALGVELSILNRRLIVRYFNSLYVFTIDTKAWSQWRTFNGTPGRFVELPVDSSRANKSAYLSATRGTNQNPSLNLYPLTGDVRVEVGPNEVVYPTEEFTNIISNYEYTLRCNVIEYTGTAGLRAYRQHSGGVALDSGNLFSITKIGINEWTMRNADVIQAQIAAFALADSSAVIEDIEIIRTASIAPAAVLTVTEDEHRDTVMLTEVIEATMLTKTYDYQAASAFKRMFYWGVDMVSPRPIYAEARPVGKKNSLTWADMETYTHEQLEEGTWENPLSWRTRSTAEISVTDENIDISENGRFYVKLKKNLRFRQIAFYLRLTSLGNKDTGPAKIFTITTLVSPKKDTIDTVT